MRAFVFESSSRRTEIRSPALLKRSFDGFLQVEVECGVDLEAALVKVLDAELLALLYVLPDLFGKIAANLRRFFLECAQDDGRNRGLLVLLLVDVVLLEHAMEDDI